MHMALSEDSPAGLFNYKYLDPNSEIDCSIEISGSDDYDVISIASFESSISADHCNTKAKIIVRINR